MTINTLEVCKTCSPKRQNYCMYPCEDAYRELRGCKTENKTDILNQNKQSKIINGLSLDKKEYIEQMIKDINIKADILYGKDNSISENFKNIKKNTRNDNDIIDEFMEDLLEVTVDQEEYLQVVNGIRMPSDVINWKYLLEFMSDRNEVFSNVNSLCEVCHSPLKEFTEYEDGMISERYWDCPHGC